MNALVLVGKFPLGIYCRVRVNAIAIIGDDAVCINDELDSPTFLYSHSKYGFFVQLACPVNGCRALVHEDNIELYKNDGTPVDLYEVDVKPV